MLYKSFVIKQAVEIIPGCIDRKFRYIQWKSVLRVWRTIYSLWLNPNLNIELWKKVYMKILTVGSVAGLDTEKTQTGLEIRFRSELFRHEGSTQWRSCFQTPCGKETPPPHAKFYLNSKLQIIYDFLWFYSYIFVTRLYFSTLIWMKSTSFA